MNKPIIRKLDDGCVVVDFGARWFRCYPNGRIVTKIAQDGRVVEREATPAERHIAITAGGFGPSEATRAENAADYCGQMNPNLG